MTTRARPMMPALIPSSSACEPRVAETCVSLISFRVTGRAPICSVVASSCASPTLLKPPEICAPGDRRCRRGFRRS